MCELELPDPLLRIQSKRIMAHPNGTLDRLLVEALDREDKRYRNAVLNALEIRKVPLANYLPTLIVAPLLAWWWGF